MATRQGPSAAFPEVHSLVVASPSLWLQPLLALLTLTQGRACSSQDSVVVGRVGPHIGVGRRRGAGIWGMHGRGRPRGTGDEILPRIRAAIFVLLVLREIPSTCRSSRTSTGHVLCARHGGCTGARVGPALMELMF